MRSWEEWEAKLSEMETRQRARALVDPTALPTEELLEMLTQDFQDLQMIELYERECIGELADRQIEEWLHLCPDLPSWFAVRSTGIVSEGR